MERMVILLQDDYDPSLLLDRDRRVGFV